MFWAYFRLVLLSPFFPPTWTLCFRLVLYSLINVKRTVTLLLFKWIKELLLPAWTETTCPAGVSLSNAMTPKELEALLLYNWPCTPTLPCRAKSKTIKCSHRDQSSIVKGPAKSGCWLPQLHSVFSHSGAETHSKTSTHESENIMSSADFKQIMSPLCDLIIKLLSLFNLTGNTCVYTNVPKRWLHVTKLPSVWLHLSLRSLHLITSIILLRLQSTT